jgi:hypothetical protein
MVEETKLDFLDDEHDELPPANLAVIEGIIKLIKESVSKNPRSGSLFKKDIQVSLSEMELASLEDLFKFAKLYAKLYRKFSSARQMLFEINVRFQKARSVLFSKNKDRVERKRMRALAILGVHSHIDDVVFDYNFFIEQFKKEKLKGNWSARIPVDMWREYKDFFENHSLENDGETKIKSKILEILKEKYHYKKIGSVQQALYRAGVTGLPRLSPHTLKS